MRPAADDPPLRRRRWRRCRPSRLVGLTQDLRREPGPARSGPDGPARESLTIIGGSGTGKSVLLRLIIGLMKPDAGQIHLEGINIIPLRETELLKVRRRFGMVFQGSALFDSLSVGENVAFALREHTTLSEAEIAARVRESLDLVGLGQIESMDPADLSGGMKKRVAVARAVALPPSVLLYDEPTTGLDPTNVEKITDLILELKTKLGVTSVEVTHDMPSALKVSDRVAMLHQERIAAVGTPEEIRRDRAGSADPGVHGRAPAAIGGRRNARVRRR
ncbi:MAG: ATP-binding cassette domain-containing protein [Candidatus Moduliflexus flocculans]|nr:ATP-binding cassette domain-containing protein [Candidatus Moduliflexus flocculans]